jgi:hypothetical protein
LSSTVKQDFQVLAADIMSSCHSDTAFSIMQGEISKSKSHTEGTIEDLESQLTYLLVREYSSIRTGKELGFPAFDEDMYVIGFFVHAPPTINIQHFIPTEQLEDDFDHRKDQESLARLLKDAIECHSKAVYSISNYDSLQSLLASVSTEVKW